MKEWEMIDFNELPPCTHGPHEAKAVFVGTGRCALCLTEQIESLQRENEELREHVKEAEAGAEEANELVKILGQRPAITPEMREILKRAFALAREIEDRELAEELCGLLIRTDPKQARLNTGGEG